VHRITDGSRFVTLMLLEFSPDGAAVRVADLGHGLGAVLSPHRPPQIIDADGTPPLGVAPEIPINVSQHVLAPEDRILLVSDGVTDQLGLDDKRFGFTRALACANGDTPESVVDSLLWSLSAHMKLLDQSDDVTVAVVGRS